MSEVRSKLRQVMREAWSDPAFETIRAGLESQAKSTGFAKCLEDHMNKGTAGKKAYEECAKKTNIKSGYRGVWGKPA